MIGKTIKYTTSDSAREAQEGQVIDKVRVTMQVGKYCDCYVVQRSTDTVQQAETKCDIVDPFDIKTIKNARLG